MQKDAGFMAVRISRPLHIRHCSCNWRRESPFMRPPTATKSRITPSRGTLADRVFYPVIRPTWKTDYLLLHLDECDAKKTPWFITHWMPWLRRISFLQFPKSAAWKVKTNWPTIRQSMSAAELRLASVWYLCLNYDRTVNWEFHYDYYCHYD